MGCRVLSLTVPIALQRHADHFTGVGCMKPDAIIFACLASAYLKILYSYGTLRMKNLSHAPQPCASLMAAQQATFAVSLSSAGGCAGSC